MNEAYTKIAKKRATKSRALEGSFYMGLKGSLSKQPSKHPFFTKKGEVMSNLQRKRIHL